MPLEDKCEKCGGKMTYREAGSNAPGYTILACDKCDKEHVALFNEIFPVVQP